MRRTGIACEGFSLSPGALGGRFQDEHRFGIGIDLVRLPLGFLHVLGHRGAFGIGAKVTGLGLPVVRLLVHPSADMGQNSIQRGLRGDQGRRV